MMTSQKYKEKELLIIHALLKLLSQGARLSEIKTSDIAEAAGIGKGTLYNYFETKEDIIARTIIYSIDTQLCETFTRLEAAEGFRQKCYTVMRIVNEIASNEHSNFHLLLFNLGGREMEQLFGGDLSFLWEYLAVIRERVLALARAGEEEGLVSLDFDAEYIYSAFASALMGFIHARCRMKAFSEEAITRAMDNAYILLLKALN